MLFVQRFRNAGNIHIFCNPGRVANTGIIEARVANPTGLFGRIFMSNANPLGGGVTVENNGLISTNPLEDGVAQGFIVFNQPGHRIRLFAESSPRPQPYGGKIEVVAADRLEVDVTSFGEVRLGNIVVDDTVTVNNDAIGAFISEPGTMIRASEFEASGLSNAIGSAIEPIRTQVEFLKIQAIGAVVIRNVSGVSTVLRLRDDARSGGLFELTSTDSINVGGILVLGGLLAVHADSGIITVRESSVLQANEGNVQLGVGDLLGEIVVQPNCRIQAQTSTDSALLGNISVTVGGIPTFLSSPIPQSEALQIVPSTANGVNVFLGVNGIRATGAVNVIDVSNSTENHFVAFDTHEANRTAIRLRGGVQVISIGN